MKQDTRVRKVLALRGSGNSLEELNSVFDLPIPECIKWINWSRWFGSDGRISDHHTVSKIIIGIPVQG